MFPEFLHPSLYPEAFSVEKSLLSAIPLQHPTLLPDRVPANLPAGFPAPATFPPKKARKYPSYTGRYDTAAPSRHRQLQRPPAKAPQLLSKAPAGLLPLLLEIPPVDADSAPYNGKYVLPSDDRMDRRSDTPYR